MSSSRFVITTLNGMFITQLAAWMTTPIASASNLIDQPAARNFSLLSRTENDPTTSLDDGWEIKQPPLNPQVGTSELLPCDAEISTRVSYRN